MGRLKASLVCLAAVVVATGCTTAPPELEFDSGSIDGDRVVAKVDAVAIVVDGSLSMADPSRQQRKLDIATGLAGAMAATPPEGMLDGAVYSFGQGPCLPEGTTSGLLGFSPYDPAAAADAVGRIQCTGGLSPLDAALRAVDRDATGADRLAVVIVSDGRHMGGDEVEAATRLVDRLGDGGVCFHPVLVGHAERGESLLGTIGALTSCSTLTEASELVGAEAMGAWVRDRLFEDDADGDGVPDRLDRCPDTPRGVEVDGKGCPLDDDGDGVPNASDRCPGTPRGVEVDEHGCPVDSDGDGVPDYKDECPSTPRGAPVDAQGCPLDSDGDEVPDYRDECPDTPRGTPVDAKGCPLAGVRVEGEEWHVEGNVLFDLNKAGIRAEARPVLDGIADWLRRHPDVGLLIEGHTDDTGSERWNQELSERRAASAKEYLVSKGVSGNRITTVGKGESDPHVPNDSPENRALNRRVEFKPLR